MPMAEQNKVQLMKIGEGCLCNAFDVVMEGGLEDNYEPLTDRMKYKIKDVSSHLEHIAKNDLSSEKDRYNARMACVYGVLSWLEGKDWIPRSSLTSVREGNVAVLYKANRANIQKEDEQPQSYTELYNYFKALILPRIRGGGALF